LLSSSILNFTESKQLH